MILQEKKDYAKANGVDIATNANLATTDQALKDAGLWDAIQNQEAVVTPQATELAMVATRANGLVNRIEIIGAKDWKEGANKYRDTYKIKDYHVMLYCKRPFWSYDLDFISAVKDHKLHTVTFQPSEGQTQDGSPAIEVASFVTVAQFLENIELDDAVLDAEERAEERTFRREMRKIKVSASPEQIRSASDMDAVFSASSAGRQ
jgi:hypothetical protein